MKHLWVEAPTLAPLNAGAEQQSKMEVIPAVIKGIQGLADFLGISKSVVQKMKNEGVIPFVQYDRVVLFRPEEVWQALKSATPRYNR